MTANESAKAPISALFSTTMSASDACSADFGQRQDQESNCDRDNAVAEENEPFDICLSFMCHLLAQPFRQINFRRWQWQSTGDRVRDPNEIASNADGRRVRRARRVNQFYAKIYGISHAREINPASTWTFGQFCAQIVEGSTQGRGSS